MRHDEKNSLNAAEYARLLAYIRAILRDRCSWAQIDAQDVLQDALCKVWGAHGDTLPRDRFGAFVVSEAQFRIGELLRRGRVERRYRTHVLGHLPRVVREERTPLECDPLEQV